MGQRPIRFLALIFSKNIIIIILRLGNILGQSFNVTDLVNVRTRTETNMTGAIWQNWKWTYSSYKARKFVSVSKCKNVSDINLCSLHDL